MGRNMGDTCAAYFRKLSSTNSRGSVRIRRYYGTYDGLGLGRVQVKIDQRSDCLNYLTKTRSIDFKSINKNDLMNGKLTFFFQRFFLY